MQASAVLCESADAVAKITLNRLERANAIERVMLEEVQQFCDIG